MPASTFIYKSPKLHAEQHFFLPGHERACDLMSYSVQDGAAKAFVKNELAMREKMSDRAQLLDKTKTLLEDCQQKRDRAATGDLPFVRQESYGAWRYKAQLAVDNAKSMLADEAGNAPFFKENPGLRQTLAAWRPLDRTMWDVLDAGLLPDTVPQSRSV